MKAKMYILNIYFEIFPASLSFHLHRVLYMQCWWRLCSNSLHEGTSVLWRSDKMDATGHLQILMQHRCDLFPFWPTKLQNEVWFMDLWPCQNRSDQHGQWCGPDGLLGERWMGDCQCCGQVQYQKVWMLYRDLRRYHLLLHHPEASVVLHYKPYHPLSSYLLSDCAGVLSAITMWREDHPVYLSVTVTNSIPPADHRDYTIHIVGDSIDWWIPTVYNGLCHALHHNYCVCAKRTPPITTNPWHASLGAESILGLGAPSPLHEASTRHSQAALQEAYRNDAPPYYHICNR